MAQRIGRSIRGSVSIITGASAAFVAAGAVLADVLIGHHPATPSPTAAHIVQDVPSAVTPAIASVRDSEPATPEAAVPPPVDRKPQPTPRRRATYARARPVVPHAVEPDIARPREPANPAIADPLTGEALRLALIEDARKTQALNKAELAKVEKR